MWCILFSELSIECDFHVDHTAFTCFVAIQHVKNYVDTGSYFCVQVKSIPSFSLCVLSSKTKNYWYCQSTWKLPLCPLSPSIHTTYLITTVRFVYDNYAVDYAVIPAELYGNLNNSTMQCNTNAPNNGLLAAYFRITIIGVNIWSNG